VLNSDRLVDSAVDGDEPQEKQLFDTEIQNKSTTRTHEV
jgi:hypothetical protein